MVRQHTSAHTHPNAKGNQLLGRGMTLPDKLSEDPYEHTVCNNACSPCGCFYVLLGIIPKIENGRNRT